MRPFKPRARPLTGIPKIKIWLYLSFFYSLNTAEQYAEAEKVYRHYLTLNTQAANAHYNLGALALAQGRNEEAILSLQRAVKDAPNDTRRTSIPGSGSRKCGANTRGDARLSPGTFSGSTQQNRQRPRQSQRDHTAMTTFTCFADRLLLTVSFAVMTSKSFWIAALSMPR